MELEISKNIGLTSILSRKNNVQLSCSDYLTYVFFRLQRVAMAGSDVTDREFLDMLLNQNSATNTAEEWFQFEQMREQRHEESIRKLQATVEAQGKILQAMADRLKITD